LRGLLTMQVDGPSATLGDFRFSTSVGADIQPLSEYAA
jgi:hypothetical protein